MILTTIAESITIDDEAGTVIVKLRPVFEHLRLAKQSFKADLKTLDGTLQTLSQRAKQALQNDTFEISKNCLTRTRINTINTKIESSYENSKKLNVDGGT